jgi:predicted nucleic acid-binding Zn ribbon protein
MEKEMRKCAICKKKFIPHQHPQKTCSRKCGYILYKQKKREYHQRPEVKQKQREYQRTAKYKQTQ